MPGIKKSSNSPTKETSTTATTNGDSERHVAICGAGLVGCLAACYFAKRNYKVSVYEYRSDIRKMKVVVGRSINMAMSVRGREGLNRIGAEERITSKGIEMYSRMLHDVKGNMSAVPYGKSTECILSIDRRYLNELLLSEAEQYPNVKIEFNQRVVKCDTITGELELENTETHQTQALKVDLIVGCDGAYSAVRQSLLKQKPIDFSQYYISSWYLELHMPAAKDGGFAMPPNHLHIWPRGNFMLIALPNQDCSFTCTLFMPLEMFERIKTRDHVLDFFRLHFPDSIDLIGKEHLLQCFFATKPSSLVSIKCNPHHGNKCVLLGDSAHAMVPFYGQGMNCGFEDVVVFFELLDKHGFSNLNRALEEYSRIRVPDAHSICDLAQLNYEEMRHTVTTRAYKLRKKIDGFLNSILPSYWIPLYSMVTFSRIRYSEIVEKKKFQDKVISCFSTAGGLALLSGLGTVMLPKLRNLL